MGPRRLHPINMRLSRADGVVVKRGEPAGCSSARKTPSPCSHEELSNESRSQRPACAVENSRKIGRPIRRKGLKALEQCRDCHEDSPDQERPGPSEIEKQGDSKIANEVVELPTEVRAWRPFFRPEGSDHQQNDDGHATVSCDSPKMLFYIGARGNRPQRDVIVLNGLLERCAGVQG